ncbi:MAG: class I SAM-dependent methyltransferase [Candidatus Promineifilaceae bacterium]|nr:class I SAM-dependent methyltransferase [Candidatus Promineifilaceae bacterium]
MVQRAWSASLRFGFRLLYNELAWTYDTVSWLVSLGQWRQWQRVGLEAVIGPRVLELAHGPGHMLIEAARRGFQVVGIDLSSHMSRQAARRLRQSRQVADLVRARSQALPFAAHTFDSVLATFPTDFIIDPATLRAVHRVLRPGGRLIVVPEARLTGGGLLVSLLEWLYRITGQRRTPMEGSQLWSSLRESFAEEGFSLEVDRHVLEQSVVSVVVARRDEGRGR